MKTFRALTCSLAALAFSAIANAAPVQYQITATHDGELIDTGSYFSFSRDPNQTLFAQHTQITATFFYDAATPATSTNNAGVSIFGPYSYYSGAVTNFSGAVSVYTFSSSIVDTLISDSPAESPQLDRILNQVPLDSTGMPTNTIFNGFSIGNFTLINFQAYRNGPSTMLSSQALPTNISGTTDDIGLSLTFKNPTGRFQTALFVYGSITPVPLPSSALFFLSGLIGLGANTARKLKR